MPRRLGRPPKPRPAELMAELERFAAEYAREIDALDGHRERLRHERDERIREAHRAGLAQKVIARVFGLSQAHVGRIIRQ